MKETQDSGRELRRIVRINDEIKSVVATAFKINLMAMNAIFLAKRAGQTALGFGVLSNELRQFAMDLQRQMNALQETTQDCEAALAKTADEEDRTKSLLSVIRRLDQRIADTVQLVELGSVLARSAKIEAAYGGDFSTSLMQVSVDFERVIGEIQQSLSGLVKHHDSA